MLLDAPMNTLASARLSRLRCVCLLAMHMVPFESSRCIAVSAIPCSVLSINVADSDLDRFSVSGHYGVVGI